MVNVVNFIGGGGGGWNYINQVIIFLERADFPQSGKYTLRRKHDLFGYAWEVGLTHEWTIRITQQDTPSMRWQDTCKSCTPVANKPGCVFVSVIARTINGFSRWLRLTANGFWHVD